MSREVTSATTRRVAYSLAAGAAAGVAGTADAAIQYSGTQDINIAQFNSLNLQIDGDVNGDILLKNYVFGSAPYQGALVNFAPGKVVGFNAGLNYATALSAGALVDATTTSGGPFAASLAFGAANPNAQFNNVTGAFIGLTFPIGASNHFGWVRVSIDNAAGTFVVNDWAYNTVAGEGIRAGQVPEPTSLGMLAAGAAGVAAMRRRRAA